MRRLRKFVRLSPAERRLVVRAVLLLWAVKAALWILPFRVVKSYVGRWSAPRIAPSHAVPLGRLTWAMAAAGTLLPGKRTCLVRALAASLLISAHGYVPTLRLGVVRDGEGALDAHAWLECNGEIVVGGSGVDRYTPFPPLAGNR